MFSLLRRFPLNPQTRVFQFDHFMTCLFWSTDGSFSFCNLSQLAGSKKAGFVGSPFIKIRCSSWWNPSNNVGIEVIALSRLPLPRALSGGGGGEQRKLQTRDGSFVFVSKGYKYETWHHRCHVGPFLTPRTSLVYSLDSAQCVHLSALSPWCHNLQIFASILLSWYFQLESRFGVIPA